MESSHRGLERRIPANSMGSMTHIHTEEGLKRRIPANFMGYMTHIHTEEEGLKRRIPANPMGNMTHIHRGAEPVLLRSACGHSTLMNLVMVLISPLHPPACIHTSSSCAGDSAPKSEFIP